MDAGTNAYRHEIAAARQAARRLRWWAAVSLILGALVTLGSVVVLFVQEDPWDALYAIVFIGLASVVGAIAMYASSWNLAMSASRLEIQLDGPTPRQDPVSP